MRFLIFLCQRFLNEDRDSNLTRYFENDRQKHSSFREIRIRSDIMGGTKRKSTKKENILDGFGNDQFINQMLQNNNSGDQLPELGLVDDLGMDTTDIKESMMNHNT